jgi:N-acetylmuramoyl-L-alanine amidase
MKKILFFAPFAALVVACGQQSPPSSIAALVDDALRGSKSRVLALEVAPSRTTLRLSGAFDHTLQTRIVGAIEKQLLGKTKALEFWWEFKNPLHLKLQAYCSGAARQVYPNPRAKPSSITGAKVMLNPGHGFTQLVAGNWDYQRPIPPSSGAFLHEDPNNLQMSVPIQAALSNAGALVSSTRNLDVASGVGVSGVEKWKEAARHHVQALGIPDHVWNSEGNDIENDCNKGRDIRVRPFYANYSNVDALISIHSNAFSDASVRGLRVYYNTEAFTPDIPNDSLVQSADLAKKLTDATLAAIQQDRPELGWTATLPIGSSGYGEMGFAKMPSVIIEVGFHTNAADATAMQETSFRTALARGVKNGLVQFFGAESGGDPVYPAAPVVLEPGSSSAPGVEISGDTITFRWQGVQNATAYGFFVSKSPYGQANLIVNRTDINASSRSISYSLADLRALAGNNLLLKWNMVALQNTTEGTYSSGLFFTLPAVTILPPPTPTGLSAAMSSDGRMFLAWNEVSSATNYGFRVSVNAQPRSIAQTVPKGSQSQAGAVAVFESNPTDTALQGQSVCFAIRANNAGGSSAFSSSVCVPFAYYPSASLQMADTRPVLQIR